MNACNTALNSFTSFVMSFLVPRPGRSQASTVSPGHHEDLSCNAASGPPIDIAKFNARPTENYKALMLDERARPAMARKTGAGALLRLAEDPVTRQYGDGARRSVRDGRKEIRRHSAWPPARAFPPRPGILKNFSHRRCHSTCEPHRYDGLKRLICAGSTRPGPPRRPRRSSIPASTVHAACWAHKIRQMVDLDSGPQARPLTPSRPVSTRSSRTPPTGLRIARRRCRTLRIGSFALAKTFTGPQGRQPACAYDLDDLLTSLLRDTLHHRLAGSWQAGASRVGRFQSSPLVLETKMSGRSGDAHAGTMGTFAEFDRTLSMSMRAILFAHLGADSRVTKRSQGSKRRPIPSLRLTHNSYTHLHRPPPRPEDNGQAVSSGSVPSPRGRLVRRSGSGKPPAILQGRTTAWHRRCSHTAPQ